MDFPFHPLAELFPLIEGKDFDEFCAGLKSDGRLHEQIVLFDGQILDGRNRQRACDATNITAHYRTFNPETEGAPLAFVIAKNLHRRHLDESQRAMIAADLATMRQGERTDVEPSANLQKVSQAEAASLVNVSPRSVASAARVKERATPELTAAVRQGVVPVSVAEKASELSPEKQREIVGRAVAGDVAGAKGEIKKSVRSAREIDLGDKQRALPTKKYGVILADPEWQFQPYSRETGMDRAADNHYPTSETDVIASRPVKDIAADDCVLFMWATAPMMPQALRVMEAWGFEYKSQVVWRKDRQGTGYWFRNEHEILLVGTRGKVPAPAPGTQWGSVVDAPVGAHSEKPDRFYELIEAYFPTLPKIELNARRARPGWDAWGLEAPESDIGIPISEQHQSVTDDPPPIGEGEHALDIAEVVEHFTPADPPVGVFVDGKEEIKALALSAEEIAAKAAEIAKAKGVQPIEPDATPAGAVVAERSGVTAERERRPLIESFDPETGEILPAGGFVRTDEGGEHEVSESSPRDTNPGAGEGYVVSPADPASGFRDDLDIPDFLVRT